MTCSQNTRTSAFTSSLSSGIRQADSVPQRAAPSATSQGPIRDSRASPMRRRYTLRSAGALGGGDGLDNRGTGDGERAAGGCTRAATEAFVAAAAHVAADRAGDAAGGADRQRAHDD